MSLLRDSQSTHAGYAVLLIRLMVGAVFLSEGIQKFLFPADVGAGTIREDWSAQPRNPRALRGRCRNRVRRADSGGIRNSFCRHSAVGP